MKNIVQMNLRSFIFLLSLAFILSVVIDIVVYKNGLYAVSADESGRTLDAYEWVFHHQQFSDVWLPFYRVVVGTGLLIYPDLFFTPRIINFLFSIAAFLSLIWFSHEVFRNKEITVLSGFLWAVFPQAVVLRVVPLSDIMFIAVVIAACASFTRWIFKQHLLFLILASMLFAVSSTIRYEGWIFSAVFVCCVPFFLLHDSPVSKRTLLFYSSLVAVIVSIFPAYWLWDNTVRTGNPFFFLGRTGKSFALITQHSYLRLVWHNPVTQFLVQNVASFNLVGIISAATFAASNTRIKKIMVFQLLVFVFLSIVAFAANTLPTHNSWRVPVVWSVALFPFTAVWLFQTVRTLPVPYRWMKGSIPALVLLTFSYQSYTATKTTAFTKEDRTMGEFFQHKLENAKNTESKIFIENPDWSYLHILIASQHPHRFIANAGFNPKESTGYLLSPQGQLNEEAFRLKGIQWFAVTTDSMKCFFTKQETIKRIRDFGAWSVFQFK